MIEIIQVGQFGKTKSILDMHRLRKLIFKDRMQWDVEIKEGDQEIDDYDLIQTVYFIVRDEQNRITGTWRMLSSTQPSMIRQLWPEFLKQFPLPVDDDVWETSRFGVHSYHENKRENFEAKRKTTALLINALVEACLYSGIKEIYTMYYPAVGRAVKDLGFIPYTTSNECLVDGKPAIVGRFKMDAEALIRIRRATGLCLKLPLGALPPILCDRILSGEITHKELLNVPN